MDQMKKKKYNKLSMITVLMKQNKNMKWNFNKKYLNR